jgi:hypothetical protein
VPMTLKVVRGSRCFGIAEVGSLIASDVFG